MHLLYISRLNGGFLSIQDTTCHEHFIVRKELKCKIKIYENKFPDVQLNYCDGRKSSNGYYLMQKGQSTSWDGPIKTEQPNQWQTTNYKDSHTRDAYQVK